ncbi:Glutaredoxin-like domain [Methylophilus rhizosphaerae]|uniref:Glutaredoxin-like domain n=1 Tax=Methylophilus rhizosphaerae TaxID=492660 RepID=A0A1G9F525_9PROT|nr:glutaredoxin family protein [Methylophilus rhizosphaerae]SDK83502.1 Glutaredoxin-like domain [Methylophilus rhizosphaerae]
MRQPLILYGTLGCHLCEKAAHVLQSLALPYQTVDIIDDNVLLERFGTSIPVLRRSAAQSVPDAYLYWPFSATQVVEWLSY